MYKLRQKYHGKVSKSIGKPEVIFKVDPLLFEEIS